MDHCFFPNNRLLLLLFFLLFFEKFRGQAPLGGTPLSPVAESQSCIPSAVMLLYLTASHMVVICLDPISGTFLTDI